MQKLRVKLCKKKVTDVNVMVSQRASRFGISPEAALVLLAKENGIGTATFQRKLDQIKQAEIRELLPNIFTRQVPQTKTAPKSQDKVKVKISRRTQLKAAIEYLITDIELKERCQDLLTAPAKFDRAINQATLVLEDRIRKKAHPQQSLTAVPLVNYAFNEDLQKTVLKVSDNSDEQRGFTSILRGVMFAFRNLTHHYLTDSFSREEAIRVCGFMDVLVRVVDKSVKIK